MDDRERLERLARYVASTVPNNSILGLGSGSTAEAVIRALGVRVHEGSTFSGVATSMRTASLADDVGIRLLDFGQVETLDLGIDGADEISPQLDLVKGRGGALLHEKLVALACQHFMIVAASEKLVDHLGTRLPLPVEIVPFGWEKTAVRIRLLGIEPSLRSNSEGKPFETDGGHYILDCTTGPIADPAKLSSDLKVITGIVEHGLFIELANEAIVIDHDGQLRSVSSSGKRSIELDSLYG
jgi:ribose 5-phosphate isomerase A